MNQIDVGNWKELYEFFEKIPANEWCKKAIKSDGKRCAIGHMIKYIWTERTATFMRNISLVTPNDEGPHESAKQNVLEYINEQQNRFHKE